MVNGCNPIQVGAVALLACILVVPSPGQRSHAGVAPPQTPPAPQVQPPSARELVRRAMERDVRNWEQEKNYTFLQRIEQRELNSDGSFKSQKSQTEEIIFLYEQPYAHLIKRNDQPLTDSEAHKVENKLNETIEKRKSETQEERRKRLADFERRHQEEHEFLLEVPDAYDFRIVSEETLNRHPVYVVAGEPRADFRPKLNAARVLPKLRPKLWIDKENFNWLKLQADVIDTITWGGFLLRLHPGSHIELEQMLVNNEVWFPVHAHINFDARVALLKAIRLDVDATFSDYRKFRSESKVISVQEVTN